MARKCDCHMVMTAFESDPRLTALPLAVRALWLVLVRHMQAAGVSVLRFGSDVQNRAEIALLVRVSETELEANLVVLLARGLLDEDGDGALGSPLLRASLARSEINRANGLKGGRPRKLTPGTDPRQVPMLHALKGGAGVMEAAAETEPEANAAAGVSLAKLAHPVEEKAKLVVTDAFYHQVGTAVIIAMGLDPAKDPVHYGIVRQWLADGATLALILQVIAAKMARGAKPKSPGYFTAAIGEALQKQAAETCVVAAASPAFARWSTDYAAWTAGGRVGPMPQTPMANQIAA